MDSKTSQCNKNIAKYWHIIIGLYKYIGSTHRPTLYVSHNRHPRFIIPKIYLLANFHNFLDMYNLQQGDI